MICRVGVCLLLASLVASDGFAQIKASEPASLKQTVDGTDITIEYSRPSVRGRENSLFGGQIYWGEVWTPGADWATTIEFSKDVKIEGVAVPAGKYSLWMTVVEGDWDVILDSRHRRWHLPELGRNDGQISFTVTPDTNAPLMETLVFYFPEVRSNGADLRFHWIHTVVDMAIEVKPSQKMTVTAEEAEPYVGAWEISMRAGQFGPARDLETELSYSGKYLSGVMELFTGEDPMEMIFAPVSDQVFTPAWAIGGEPASLFNGYFFEFVLDDSGRASTFEARDNNDNLWMTGERKK